MWLTSLGLAMGKTSAFLSLRLQTFNDLHRLCSRAFSYFETTSCKSCRMFLTRIRRTEAL